MQVHYYFWNLFHLLVENISEALNVSIRILLFMFGILRFGTIWLPTDSYHKMTLKWLCILGYMNDSLQFLVINTNHTIHCFFFLFLLFFHQFSWKIEKLYKLKFLNEKKLKEHFWIYPIWLFHYFICQSLIPMHVLCFAI